MKSIFERHATRIVASEKAEVLMDEAGFNKAIQEIFDRISGSSYSTTDDLDETCVPHRWAEYYDAIRIDDVAKILNVKKLVEVEHDA